MKPLPHRYDATITAGETSAVEITSDGLPPLASASPKEFDGPGNLWSPETLMVAAAADCLVLTFRAIANASKLRWKTFICSGKGTVDRIDGVTRFTAIDLNAQLVLPAGADREKAVRLLEKAEKSCLIANSLKCEVKIAADVAFEETVLAPTA